MNKKQRIGVGIISVVLLIIAIVAPLFTPIMSEKYAGDNMAARLDYMIQREYDLEEQDGEYYYNDQLTEDEEFINHYKNENKKISRDLKSIEKYNDNISIYEEINYLVKLSKYYHDLKEGMLSQYTGQLVTVIVIIAIIAAMIIYSVIMIIISIINMVKGDFTSYKSHRRARRLLYFIIPLMLAVKFQSSIISQYIEGSIGIGLIILCIIIGLYTIISMLSEVNFQIEDKESSTKTLVVGIMIATVMSLSLNFATGIAYSRNSIPVGNCLPDGVLYYEVYDEWYELSEEYEDEHNATDDEDTYDSKDYGDSKELKYWKELNKYEMLTGVLTALAITVTLLMIGSIGNSVYKRRRLLLYPFLAGLNIMLYIASIFTAIEAINKYNRYTSKYGEYTANKDAGSLGMSFCFIIALNILIIIMEIYRIIMNKKMTMIQEAGTSQYNNWASQVNATADNLQNGNISNPYFSNSQQADMYAPDKTDEASDIQDNFKEEI